MSLGWKGVESAPKDGTIVRLRNGEVAPKQVFAWSRTNKRWETKVFTVMGAIVAWWDENAAPPTEWAALDAA